MSELGPIVQFTKAKVQKLQAQHSRMCCSWFLSFFRGRLRSSQALVDSLLDCLFVFRFSGSLSERQPGRRSEGGDEGLHGAGEQHAAHCRGTGQRRNRVSHVLLKLLECPLIRVSAPPSLPRHSSSSSGAMTEQLLR